MKDKRRKERTYIDDEDVCIEVDERRTHPPARKGGACLNETPAEPL